MPGTVSASASRIAWSRALRLAGWWIVRRATCSAGKSSRSLPSASSRASGLLEDNERVALGHRLTLLHEDLLDRALVLRLDRHLHLHRLEHDHGVTLLDRVPDGDLDLPHRARDVGFDLRHRSRSLRSLAPDGGGTIATAPDTVAIVCAHD